MYGHGRTARTGGIAVIAASDGQPTLAEAAHERGVSANDLILLFIAEGLARLEAGADLTGRAEAGQADPRGRE
jgi:hypothetical protein